MYDCSCIPSSQPPASSPHPKVVPYSSEEGKKMASLSHGSPNCKFLWKNGAVSLMGISALPSFPLMNRPFLGCMRGRIIIRSSFRSNTMSPLRRGFSNSMSKKVISIIPRSSNSSNSGGDDDTSDQGKTPFGYTRKDVLLIGLGVTVLGIGLKIGLEFAGVDPLQAGNVVQLVLVLGLTVGWISTYIFRVSNKEMTYAQQLRDYEKKVMEKRLEGLTEAELEALLEQVEEEKRRLAAGD